MKTELLAKSPLLALPLFALFFFLLVFAVVIVVTMTKRARSFDSVARLPIDDDDEATPVRTTNEPGRRS